MEGVIEALVVRRTYAHPPETVFKAWTEPRRLEKWFCPNSKNKVRADVNLRIGGVYRIQMISSSGDTWTIGGVYQRIDRPSDLGFTWKWEDSPEEASLVEVAIRELERGTEVIVNHSRLESEESRENHGQGWNASMERLMGYLDDPMEGMHLTSPDLVTAAAQIQQAQQVARMAISRMRDTFTHVPDSKLLWTPEPTSKHCIKILTHTAFSNQHFAAVLRGDELEGLDMHAIVQETNAKADQIQTREEALKIFDATSQEVLKAYEQLDPVRLTTDPRVNFILTLVGRHVDSHAAQIDYLQTIWGDQQDYFGM